MFKETCEVYGIKKTRTTPIHSQSNGMVERFKRTPKECLRKVVRAQQDSDEHIPMNSTYTSKEERLYELHEFVHTRINMISDGWKIVQQTQKKFVLLWNPAGMDRIK